MTTEMMALIRYHASLLATATAKTSGVTMLRICARAWLVPAVGSPSESGLTALRFRMRRTLRYSCAGSVLSHAYAYGR
jgi:hypothetical protein